jgi:hypothetical protein
MTNLLRRTLVAGALQTAIAGLPAIAATNSGSLMSDAPGRAFDMSAHGSLFYFTQGA